jgi:hypothetical protein
MRLDLIRARHRLSKMPMRHGIVFDEGRMWTDRPLSLTNANREKFTHQA